MNTNGKLYDQLLTIWYITFLVDRFLPGNTHCSLGLGLHCMTGQKQPILLLSKFGHCISYEKVKEIETAQAELALLAQKTSSILPIQPMADDTKVNIIILLLYYIMNVIICAHSAYMHDIYEL